MKQYTKTIKLIETILSPYDALQGLECDGFTRVADYLLVQAKVPHICFMGKVSFKGDEIPFHMWIKVDGYIYVDYRLRMWFGPDAPHGVFKDLSSDVVYSDAVVYDKPVINSQVFYLLTDNNNRRLDFRPQTKW